ncbi:restriction endonuclease subunit S [Victivallis vadensis]|uniref:restriction endonuclease subunit S n=1 Tax=Victivallis vadensis TaxID=172901 RepID=UPI003CFE40B1
MEMFITGDPYPRETLKNYISQIRGVSYKPSDLRSSLSDDSVLLLRANNIDKGKINHDDVQYVSVEKVSESQLIQQNDIILCASSGSLEHVGKSALCSSCTVGETFGAFCKLIRPKGRLQAEYIAAYLETDEYRDKIMQLACGSNINNLKNEHIDYLPIPIPDEEAQLRFIAIAHQSDKSKHLLEICPFF